MLHRFYKSSYECFLKCGGKNTRSFDLFKEFGIENCKIELIESYPCANKEELHKREGFHIQGHKDCVNKNIAGRSMDEYYRDNKEICLQRSRDYKKKNEEHVKESWKQYYLTRKEGLNEANKQYRDTHKDEIKIKNKEYQSLNRKVLSAKHQEYVERNKEWLKKPVFCGCGSVYQYMKKSQHEKTQKHQDWLKQQEQEQEQ